LHTRRPAWSRRSPVVGGHEAGAQASPQAAQRGSTRDEARRQAFGRIVAAAIFKRF
jgi:hypothetical protein